MNVRVKSRLKEKKKEKKESHEKKSEITKGKKKSDTLLYKSRKKKVKITVCRWDEEKYRPKEQHTNLFQRADTNLFV